MITHEMIKKIIPFMFLFAFVWFHNRVGVKDYLHIDPCYQFFLSLHGCVCKGNKKRQKNKKNHLKKSFFLLFDVISDYNITSVQRLALA